MRPLLPIVLIVFFSGCSNLMPADPAAHELAGAHVFGTTALAFMADGRHFVSGGFRGELRVWDTAAPQRSRIIPAHRKAVRAILPLAADDFVSGGDDGRVIRWHHRRIAAEARAAAVSALALFQGRVVSGHRDGTLRVWSADSLRPLRTVALGDAVVALDAHGTRLAVGLDSAVVLLDEDFSVRRRLPSRFTPHDLQFSPDGRTLAAGHWFRLGVWDLASGAWRSVPTEHNGLLTSIAFSPDGRTLATLGRHTDSAIRILDTRDFSVVRRYRAHVLCGAVIRYSPDGALLVSGSDDESIRIHAVGRHP